MGYDKPAACRLFRNSWVTAIDPVKTVAGRQQSFEQITADFRAALTWLRDVGIRVDAGRLKDYEQFCRLVEKASRADWEFTAGLVQFVEIERIVDVWRYRAELAAIGNLSERLTKIVGGRRLHSEDTDHSARNYLFELSAACWLLKGGLTLTSSNDGDIAAERSGRRFAIECKRPASERAVVKRIREASKQIEKRRTFGRMVGIVLVDFTLLINPKSQYWEVSRAQRGDDVLSKYIDANKEMWHRLMIPQLLSRDDAFVGCYVSIPCWDMSASSWCFCDRWLVMGNNHRSVLGDYWYGVIEADFVRSLSGVFNPQSSSEVPPAGPAN